MSTEYHITIRPNLMDTLRGVEPLGLKIGTSAGGWCFSLWTYPEHGIESLTDWYSHFKNRRNIILDEYERQIPCAEMIDVITNRSGKIYPDTKIKSGNYRNLEHFMESNHAMFGPNGCLRSRISHDHLYCIGHGAGTWDIFRE
jgi:hypothetical protein